FEKVLTYRVINYQKTNPDLMAAIPPRQLDTGLVKPVMKTRIVPVVNFSYRYVSGDTALYVKYTQDTAISQVYAFPVRITVRSGDVMDTAYKIVDQIDGELKVK